MLDDGVAFVGHFLLQLLQLLDLLTDLQLGLGQGCDPGETHDIHLVFRERSQLSRDHNL